MLTSPSRVCIITGGTSGIGQATATALAARGFNLVLLGRNQRRGEALSRRFARQHHAGRFEFIHCDLASSASVREAAAAIRQRHPLIDVLINNAGARIDTYQESVDGFELSFAANYLGHFLLTGLLMDRILEAPAARMVNVSSRRHRCINSVDNWILTRDKFDRWGAYDRSKLALTVFGFELARRLAGTSVTSSLADPGIVASGFARNNGLIPWGKHLVSSLVNRQLVSPAHAAETIVHLATSPGIRSDQTGGYYYEGEAIQPSPLALETEVAKALWASSLEWVGLNETNCAAWHIFGPRPSTPS